MEDFSGPITRSRAKRFKEQLQLFVQLLVERGLSKYGKLHFDSIEEPKYVNRIGLTN